MNCSRYEPVLSAYVDGSIGAEERAAVDVHLRTCAACRALMDDLTAVRAAAADLEPLIPPARVWHQLASATARPKGGLHGAWLAWRPVGAVAMTALIATGLWRVGTLLQPPAASRGASDLAVTRPVESGSDLDANYTSAIARLELVATADRDALDPQTATAFDASLTVLDRAITESRAALRTEPESESAQVSLFEALRRKVALLQEMLALINEMRKGNQDGAARILSEMNR